MASHKTLISSKEIHLFDGLGPQSRECETPEKMQIKSAGTFNKSYRISDNSFIMHLVMARHKACNPVRTAMAGTFILKMHLKIKSLHCHKVLHIA